MKKKEYDIELRLIDFAVDIVSFFGKYQVQ
jgi:hypothetical protein